MYCNCVHLCVSGTCLIQCIYFLGKREILCWGFNGDPSQYVGDPSFPAQSVRFQEDSEYVANVLRAKEKGDWRQMTLEEKKTRMF